MEEPWQTGEGVLEILEFSANGRSLKEASCAYVDIELRDSQPHSWTLTISDPFAEYHPEHVGGDWEGVMTDAKDHLFRLRCRWSGEELNFVGIPTGVAHNRVTDGGQVSLDLTWSGTCLSWLLTEEGVTQPTLRSTESSLVFRHQVIEDALEPSGIEADDLPTLPALRLQHRQNFRPIDMITRYCERDGYGWEFDGDRIRFYPAELKSSPDWVYGPDTCVSAETSDMSSPDLYSTVVIRRLVESGDMAGQPVTMTSFGDSYSLSFSPPLNGLSWRYIGTPIHGIASDFIARNAAGDVVAAREKRGSDLAEFLYSAPLNAIASISWTFGNAVLGSTYTEGFGQLLFSGVPPDMEDSDFPAEFETDFSKAVTSPELLAIVGPRQRELEIDETVGTQADAEQVGLNHLARLLLNRAPRAITAPLNLGVRPGHTLRIDDPKLNRSQRGFVRRVALRIAIDPAIAATTIEGTGWKT